MDIWNDKIDLVNGFDGHGDSDQHSDFEDMLQDVLSQLFILPRTLVFEGIYDEATVPMIRGVWGKALYMIDRGHYQEVFEGGSVADQKVPKYLMRHCRQFTSSEDQTALEWILLGNAARKDPLVLIHAWLEASGMGLGPERQPFILRSVLKLDPANAPHGFRNKAWPASAAVWPLEGDPASTPCVLAFETPLKVKAQNMQQFSPSFTDVCLRALDRVLALAGLDHTIDARNLKRETLVQAREIPEISLGWNREHLIRYSARQQKELEYYGVVGAIGLPEGPGPLWPLLAASLWIHVGKGTTLGMGMPGIYSWQ